jgi:NAD(P)-dependent dehydrogenase (short-subunit alcohol dehydrogenase family)
MTLDPTDSVVLITGSGRGLGRACALDLASRGMRVIVNDIDVPAAESVVEEIRQAGGTAASVFSPIIEWEGAKELVARAAETYGRLDSVVSNAGLLHTSRPEDETEENVLASVRANLLGTMFVGSNSLRHFLHQGSGVLLNTTSGALFGLPETGTYGAMKGAVVSLTRSWARDLRDTNVRVTAWSPRARTRMSVIRRGAPEALLTPPPENIVPLVAALLTPDQPSLNGRVFYFDGKKLSVIQQPELTELAAAEPDAWTDEILREALGTL